METALLAIKRWMDKQNMLHPYKRMYNLALKKWMIATLNYMNKFQVNFVELRKPEKREVHTLWFYLYEIVEK